jgi:hypothetical protein
MGILSFSPWNLRQINSPAGLSAGVTDSPAAAGDPFTCLFGSQQHIGYLDEAGLVHDCWYDGTRGRWNHQQVNGQNGATNGPPAVGGPFIWTAGPEQHFTYRTADGVICDSWYAAGRWHLQRITGPEGLTRGPAAAADPFAGVFANQPHIAYLDENGLVQDCWYESGGWNLQQINGDGGLTRGSLACGGPFIWMAGAAQQHFTYYDTAGTIHDSWFDGERWNLQHINGAGGLTDGPRAARLPSVRVHGDQQHCCYLGRASRTDEEGIIHDAWFDGAKERWNLQQINGDGGLTPGPAAVSGPFASVFSPQPPSSQAGLHVTYTDSAGAVCDSWFDSRASSWNLRWVTGADSATGGPPAAGAPCVWTAGASQQHFTYRTGGGAIYDAWFNAAAPS